MKLLFKKLLKYESLIVVLISTFTYLIFYSRLAFTNNYISGSDPIYYHYPNRYFLWESLQHGVSPFYTERIFSGFPIYADITSGFLNPINVLSIVLFGPFDSYKILHFVIYLFGSWGLYKFLKNYSVSFAGFFISNLVYFFSFFSLYHLKHFDITSAMYLLPLAMYFLQMYGLSSKIRYILLNALIVAQALYFGSLQMVVLSLICCGVYALIYFNRHQLLQFALFFGVTFITLILPLVVPAYDLYTQSVRGESGISYLQGSFSPLMFFNLVYPFSFGVGPQYKWEMISKDFLIQETYVYVGIVSFIMALVTFLKLKDIKLRTFLFSMLGVFLVLGFLESVPVLNLINLPILSMFRYWGRSAILFVFAISILAGVSFNYLNEKIKRENVKLVLLCACYLMALLGIDLINHGQTSSIIKLALNGAVVKDFNLVVFVLFSILSLVALIRLKSKTILCILVFLDLVYFSFSVIPPQLEPISKIKPQVPTDNYKNLTGQRVLILDSAFTRNLNLYNKLFGIMGYSQMKPAKYTSLLASQGLKSPEKYDAASSLSEVELKANLGVSAVIDPTNYVNTNTVTVTAFPFSNSGSDLLFSNVIYNEGQISSKAMAVNDTTVNTYIRNYLGWDIYIDGIKTNYSRSPQEVFITFPLPKGAHQIELKYVPYPLYFGIKLSAFGGLVLLIMLIFTHEQDRIYKNGRVRKDVLVASR